MTDYIDRQAAIDALCKAGCRSGYCGVSCDDVKAIEQLPSVQQGQQWIPCSERLPKQGQEVICQCRASIITVLKLDAGGDWYQDANHCYMRGFVIAWMPLPEPYKEGEAHETD